MPTSSHCFLYLFPISCAGESREKKDLVYVDAEGVLKSSKPVDEALVERRREGVHPGKVTGAVGRLLGQWPRLRWVDGLAGALWQVVAAPSCHHDRLTVTEPACSLPVAARDCTPPAACHLCCR